MSDVPVHIVNESLKFEAVKELYPSWESFWAWIREHIADVLVAGFTGYLGWETRKTTIQNNEMVSQSKRGARRIVRTHIKNLIIALGRISVNPLLNSAHVVPAYVAELSKSYKSMDIQTHLNDDEYEALDDFEKRMTAYTPGISTMASSIEQYSMSYVDEVKRQEYVETLRFTIYMFYQSMDNVYRLFIAEPDDTVNASIANIVKDEAKYLTLLENMRERTDQQLPEQME